MKLYFQDKRSDLDVWQGFLLSCNSANKPLLRVQTAQPAHIKLTAGEQALLWAEIVDGYYGVSALRALPQSADVQLLPHIHTAELMQARHLQGEVLLQYWARFFVQALQDVPISPLYSGLWSLEYTELTTQGNSPTWLSRKKAKWCKATAEDQQFLSSHEVYIDWGGCGNGNIINLFAPYASPAEAGRIKWWLKVACEQTLPPLLLWYISALDAFVLLDGHDRLQTALINGIAPDCLVLSSYTERAYPLDEDKQAAILKQLVILEQKIADGVKVSADALAGVNNALVGAYDNRPAQRHVTRGFANITLEQWQAETQVFRKELKRRAPHEAIEQFHLMDQ